MRLVETNRTVAYNLVLSKGDLDDLVGGRLLVIDIDGNSVYLKYEV